MTYTCKNCKEVSESQFCSNCGQEKIDRITFKILLRLFTSAIEFERGLLLNLKELTLRPSSMIKSYLDGRTKSYLNPFSYFLVAFGFYSLAFTLSDKIDIYGLDINSMSGIDQEKQPFSFIIIISGHLAFAVANYVVFRKKWNFIESYIISLFITSQMLVLSSFLIFFPIIGIPDWIYLIAIIYIIWGLIGLYEIKLKFLFFRLFVIFVMTIAITASVTLLFILVTQKNYTQDLISSRVYYLNKRINSIEKNTELLYPRVAIDSSYFILNESTRSLTIHLTSLKEEIIFLSGGMNDDGTYVGINMKVDRILFQNNSKRLEELKFRLSKWSEKLKLCKCEEQEEYFVPDIFKNMSLIDALTEINQIYILILTIERDCILTMEKKRITNAKNEYAN